MSYYFSSVLGGEARKICVEAAVKELKKLTFDVIVVAGRSGLSVGAIVGFILDKPVAIVTKDAYTAHSQPHLAIPDFDKSKGEVRAIFLDDFISSGVTFRNAESKIPTDWKFIAAYTYFGQVYNGSGDLSIKLMDSNVRIPVIGVSNEVKSQLKKLDVSTWTNSSSIS